MVAQSKMGIWCLAVALVSFAGLILSCGEDPVEPEPELQTVRSTVDRGGICETVTPSQDSEELEPETRVDDDGTTWECDATHYSMVEAPDNYHTFNPNADVIYPGCLLQGATLHYTNPTPIAVPRGGATIVINSTNGDPVTDADVEEVSLSEITSAVNTLIGEHSGELPMRLSLDIHDVSSFEELAFRLGVNISTCTVDFRSQMSFSTEKTYNRFMVKLTQQYYTMMFETPTDLSDFFQPDIQPEQLEPYIEPGNPATYISSVTYGRAFYLLLESTASKDSIDAAFNATWGGIVSGEVTAEVNYVRQLSDVKFHLFVMGGESQEILPLFQMDPEALNTFISDYDIGTGVPLSYAIRNLKDNSMVNVRVATEFDVLDCRVVTLGDRYSGFETGSRDGWTVYGGAAALTCQNDPPSVLGGYYLHADDQEDDSWYFNAPSKFTGNWDQLYGGRLTFHLWSSGNVPDDATSPNDVHIMSTYNRSLSLGFYNAAGGHSLGYPNSSGFKRYDLDLDTSYTWYYSAPGVDRIATEQDIRAVFEEVIALRIKGDYLVGYDWTRLDEVELLRP